MHIAYLVNQYPGISHSFIRREIQALEKSDVEVFRVSVRTAKSAVIADEDKAEAEKTHYILGKPAGGRVGAFFSSLIRRPGGAFRALLKAIHLGWRSGPACFRHGAYYIEALILATWLRARGINHIHAHFGTNPATVALLASIINNGSFSFTVHGPEEFDKSAAISIEQKIKATAACVGVSSFGASQLRRLVSPEAWPKIHVVHCGIEAGFFAGDTKAPSGKSFVCVGRLCEQKGQVTLIEAASLLKQEGRAFKIVLVGDGEMRADIERAVAAHDLGAHIEFAGWKTPGEVREAIENARAFVLPSYAEGLPVSIMEAFCLERPVISTYIAGIPELVRPNENGWLAPAGDAKALARAMAAALDASDDEIHAMGRAGKERTVERHNVDTEAQKLRRIFEAACEDVL